MNVKKKASKKQKPINIAEADLPLSCPMPNSTLWNMHPKVFIPFGDDTKATCPYCGAKYILKN